MARTGPITAPTSYYGYYVALAYRTLDRNSCDDNDLWRFVVIGRYGTQFTGVHFARTVAYARVRDVSIPLLIDATFHFVGVPDACV